MNFQRPRIFNDLKKIGYRLRREQSGKTECLPGAVETLGICTPSCVAEPLAQTIPPRTPSWHRRTQDGAGAIETLLTPHRCRSVGVGERQESSRSRPSPPPFPFTREM